MGGSGCCHRDPHIGADPQSHADKGALQPFVAGLALLPLPLKQLVFRHPSSKLYAILASTPLWGRTTGCEGAIGR